MRNWEATPPPEGGPQSIGCIMKLGTDESFEKCETVKIEVTQFKDPGAAVAAVLQFAQEVARAAMEGEFGPSGMMNAMAVISGRAQLMYPGDPDVPPGAAALCEEHAAELADKMGADTIGDAAAQFLKELNGES